MNELVAIARSLRDEVERLRFSAPVSHVYNPLVYAWQAHESYLTRYGRVGEGVVLLLGMNPGPWGMAQTGVPFGEVSAVRDWLAISCPIGRPPREHDKRPVTGLACQRNEVSGRRLWGWARQTFHSPDAFFQRFFVSNYCPLLFLEQSGRNRTPDRLPVAERKPLLAACDLALQHTVDLLRPAMVIGVGGFAARQARASLAGREVTVGQVLHPSPASPAANRGWAAQATRELTALGIELPTAEP